MSRRHLQYLAFALSVAVGSFFTAPAPAQSPSDEIAAAQKLLQAAGLPVDAPGVVQFFRERTLSKEQIADLENQVRLLGSTVYSERVKATAALAKAGPLARKLLLDIVNSPDTELETVRRAEAVLQKIAEGKDVPLALAATRVLAHLRPPEAAQVLLDYVPFAYDEGVFEEVQRALGALAVRDGALEPTVLRALKDRQAVRRAAAAEAIIHSSGLKHKDLVTPLLTDPAPSVRVAIVTALVEAHDREAIGLLVELLTAAPADQVWHVEDLLHRLAGESAPDVWIGSKTSAEKVQASWRDWQQKHAATVDFAKLAQVPPYRGFVLVTVSAGSAAGKGLTGKIMEVRRTKEIAWQFETVRNPMDAHLVGTDRVLIAEYLDRRVTERDRKGNIIWEKSFDLPVACQRLANGNTFVATRRQLLIVDRAGKEIFNHSANLLNICGAACASDGQMVFVTMQGKCTWLDPEGREIKSFQIDSGKLFNVIGAIDVLPGHRILVPLTRAGRVVEVDQNGQVVWQANVAQPISAVRLPGGRTLVAAGARVIEIDRAGQEVWSFQPEGRPFRLHRR